MNTFITAIVPITELLYLSKKEIKVITKHYFIKRNENSHNEIIDKIAKKHDITPVQAYVFAMLVRLVFLKGQPISIYKMCKYLGLNHSRITELRFLSNLQFAIRAEFIKATIPRSLKISKIRYSLLTYNFSDNTRILTHKRHKMST